MTALQSSIGTLQPEISVGALIHSDGFVGVGRLETDPGEGVRFMNTGRVRQKDRAVGSAVHIRWMIRRDMPEVMRTERASFEYSWTEDDFLRCLRQRNCIGMVA